jgi:hypothetical protein
MSDRQHRGCVVDQRQEAEAARRALLEHECIWGVSLTQPAAGEYDAWELEASVVPHGHDVDGWAPPLADTQRVYGLTLQDYQPRSPTEYRAVLTL